MAPLLPVERAVYEEPPKRASLLLLHSLLPFQVGPVKLSQMLLQPGPCRAQSAFAGELVSFKEGEGKSTGSYAGPESSFTKDLYRPEEKFL